MVCTITTSTVSLITTASAASFGMIATLGLLAFLTIRELASVSENRRLRFLGSYLSIGIIPLLFVFCLILFVNLV